MALVELLGSVALILFGSLLLVFPKKVRAWAISAAGNDERLRVQYERLLNTPNYELHARICAASCLLGVTVFLAAQFIL